jgi:sodium transport system permease protein
VAAVSDGDPTALLEGLGVFLLGVLVFLVAGGLLFPLGAAGVVLAQLAAFAGVPALAARARGGRRWLGLTAPSGRAVAGAVLIGASAWYLLTVVAAVQELVAPMPAALRAGLEEMIGPGAGPLAAALAVYALTPGICEELLCRGALLSAVRTRLGPAAAVGVTALLFAALHLSPYRFVPQLLLGLSLGAITVWSRSVVPAMIVHALNNGAVVVLSRGAAEIPLAPAGLVAAGAVCLAGHALCRGARSAMVAR